MSLLEGSCAKTSWRVLLFHAIFGIKGALIVCFDIWRFKQGKKKRFWWLPLWFWATRALFNCACVYEFREVRIRSAQRFYFVGALLFRDNVQTDLEGASIREGASNRDITVLVFKHNFEFSNTAPDWLAAKPPANQKACQNNTVPSEEMSEYDCAHLMLLAQKKRLKINLNLPVGSGGRLWGTAVGYWTDWVRQGIVTVAATAMTASCC